MYISKLNVVPNYIVFCDYPKKQQKDCRAIHQKLAIEEPSFGSNIHISKVTVRGEAAGRGWRSQAEFVSASRFVLAKTYVVQPFESIYVNTQSEVFLEHSFSVC